jgi:hypothetical protein
MGEPRPQNEHVVDMVEYLRDTLAEIDAAIAELNERRLGIAVRLAVIASANDPLIQSAAEDYMARVAEQRPYEDATDANELIMEAHRRYVV